MVQPQHLHMVPFIIIINIMIMTDDVDDVDDDDDHYY